MIRFWQLFYNLLIIPFLYLGLRILGLFNEKTRRGIKGRKRVFENIILDALSLDKTRPLIWFHSSSLGEFEQAKPIIQKLKEMINVNILVTFFSPSGYENSVKYPYADIVSYIPFDTNLNAETFLKIVRPDLSVLMRYDIWPNYIWQMHKTSTPCFLVDATLRKKSKRLLPVIRNFHKHLFTKITSILTVSEQDRENFLSLGCKPEQVKAVGDTRFDRVYQRSITAKERKLINENLFSGKKVLVAGSTWEADEEILIPSFLKLSKADENVVMILVPHEPTIHHLEKIENEFAGKINSIRFSFLNNYNNERVILVDSIGILLTLYTYADVAFVGGSFKQNVHNVLEAAVYGVPVLFGPKIENSQEAIELMKIGGGIRLKNKFTFYRQLRILFSDEERRKEIGAIALNYVRQNLGATDKILSEIITKIELQ
ncbi:MAG: glycosyltransferase N-terminal domain-containing protein [Ignavibacteriaceae bacterium]